MKIEDDKISSIKWRNIIACMLIAFLWGFSYISELAIQFFYKDVLKIEPSKLLQIQSIIHFPWAIKPIFGLFTDLVPIFGYRRKSYLIICAITIISCYMTLSFFSKTPELTTLLLLINSASVAFISVIAEAMLIEHCQIESDIESKSKEYISYFQFSKHFGFLLSSYLKGLFVDIMNLRTIFLISGCLPFLYIIMAFIYVEIRDKKELEHSILLGKENSIVENRYESIAKENDEKHKSRIGIENGAEENEEILRSFSILIEDKNHIKKIHFENTFQDFWDFITRKQIIIPILFIIAFMSAPSYYDPFFYFLTNEIKLKATVLGELSFIASIAMLLGIVIYKYYLKDTNFKIMIVIGTIFSCLICWASLVIILRLNLKWGIPDFWLLVFTSSFLSILGEFILMPILALTCMLCPKNLEGTVFSVFTSAINLGRIISGLSGSLLTNLLNVSAHDFKNLPWLIIIAKFCSLLPLFFLCCIDDSYFHYSPDINPEGLEKIAGEKDLNISIKNDNQIIKLDISKDNDVNRKIY